MSALGESLRTIRLAAGFGLRQAARALEVSSGYLSRVEQGKESPSDALLGKMAGYYNVDEDWLYSKAGRVAPDVLAIVLSDPRWPRFLRLAQEMGRTGADLLGALEILERLPRPEPEPPLTMRESPPSW